MGVVGRADEVGPRAVGIAVVLEDRVRGIVDRAAVEQRVRAESVRRLRDVAAQRLGGGIRAGVVDDPDAAPRPGALSVSPSATGAIVRVTIKNVGRRAGAAVPQLYLGMRSLPGVAQPPAQLKGLAHITLAPGRSARVGFRLDARALSYWDAGASVWRVAAGCYGVMVGSSSRDHPLRALLAEGGARCTRRGAGRAL